MALPPVEDGAVQVNVALRFPAIAKGAEGAPGATGGGLVTVTPTGPLLPSDVAMMNVVPTPVAVTNPLEITVATEMLADSQVTVRPVSRLPVASRTTAEAWVVCPRIRLLATRVAATVATGAGGVALTVTIAVAVLLPPEFVAVNT